MGREVYLFNILHKKTNREYLPRMLDDKVSCMLKAKEYEFDYWDGDRKYGYGGYKYDGRWKDIAQRVIKEYKLTNESSVLDVGCGKAFLLHEIKTLLPDIRVAGFDISKHAISETLESVKGDLCIHDARKQFPFETKEFDLVISMGCLHNLRIFELKKSLAEMQRVAKRGYIMVESYRNEQELFNLQCWALTCESFFDKAEWIWIFEEFGFTGDYEFIFFE